MNWNWFQNSLPFSAEFAAVPPHAIFSRGRPDF